MTKEWTLSRLGRGVCIWKRQRLELGGESEAAGRPRTAFTGGGCSIPGTMKRPVYMRSEAEGLLTTYTCHLPKQ